MGEQASLRRPVNKELRERTASRATMFRGCLAGADAATKQKFNMLHAVVAELADAPDLGSGVFDVGVQVPSSAPHNFICGYGGTGRRARFRF